VQVETHLDECERCRALAAELADVNGALRAVIAPLVLGVGAAGYLARSARALRRLPRWPLSAVLQCRWCGGRCAGSVPRQLIGVGASAAALAVAIAIALTSGQSTQIRPQPPRRHRLGRRRRVRRLRLRLRSNLRLCRRPPPRPTDDHDTAADHHGTGTAAAVRQGDVGADRADHSDQPGARRPVCRASGTVENTGDATSDP